MHNLLSRDCVIERCLALGRKYNNTIFHSEKGIILGTRDVVTGENVCTTLTNDDLTSCDGLAMVYLDPEILRI